MRQIATSGYPCYPGHPLLPPVSDRFLPIVMPKTPEQLLDFLAELGIATRTFEHPPVYTVEESKALRGKIAGAHCKSLFLKDKRDHLYLVVCLEHRRLDLKRLEPLIGAARLSFGKAELLMERLGVIPGSVTPFGLINDAAHLVQVVLDREMMAIDPLNYHPLHNAATTQISPADFRRFLAATGHRAVEVDLTDYRPLD